MDVMFPLSFCGTGNCLQEQTKNENLIQFIKSNDSIMRELTQHCCEHYRRHNKIIIRMLRVNLSKKHNCNKNLMFQLYCHSTACLVFIELLFHGKTFS